MNPRQEFIQAIKDIVPLAIGVAIYGLAFGVLAAQANMSSLQVGIMGATVFAGAAQIMAIERLVAGAGAIAAIVAAVALNLRLILITASVQNIFQGRPWWQRLLGAHMATDENWALLVATQVSGIKVGYWYLIGGGLCLLATWCIATVVGLLFASAIPEPRALGMDFAFTAAFIAIARSLWRGRADVIPWLISFTVIALCTWTGALESSWALILGGLCGAASAGILSNE